MGTVTYHVRIQVRAGECQALISGLSHTGNKNAYRSPINMGQLMRTEDHVTHALGLSHPATVRLHAELRTAAETRLNALLAQLEARIRASVQE